MSRTDTFSTASVKEAVAAFLRSYPDEKIIKCRRKNQLPIVIKTVNASKRVTQS